MMRFIIPGVLAMLSMLQPFETANLLPVCAAAILLSVPGLLVSLLLKRNQAAWANFLAFGDMLSLALLVSVFCAWPELAVFGVCRQLASRFVGGWLLRREGIRREKNFTLILAYRQTIKHSHRFPDEIHPSENPLFEPARNAQEALLELLPAAGMVLGIALRSMGFYWPAYPAAPMLAAGLMVLLIVQRLFSSRSFRFPSLRSLPMAVLRFLAMSIGVFLLWIAFPVADRHMLLVCVLLSHPQPAEELRRSGVEMPLCRAVADASRWSFLLWAISVAMLFLFHE